VSGAQHQALFLGFVCLFAAIALTTVLLLTRVSKFGAFAVANLLLGATVFGAEVAFGFSGWRSEILAASVVELPAVLLISWVCLALAGGLPGRLNQPPSEPVVRHPRVRKALGWAPATLLACWILAVLVGLVWPSPAMQPYSSAPAQFLAFKWPISISQSIFAGLAATVFTMAAISVSSAPVLRLRNGTFAISMAMLAMIGGESALIAGARLWIDGPQRREVIDALLVFEMAVAIVCFASLVFGVTLRYTPAIAATVLNKVHTGWLPARERFESSGWQSMADGRTRGVSRVTYRIEEAARLAGLPRYDAERAVAAIQLIAVMRHPSTETGGVTSAAARELYEMEKEILGDQVLASKIQSSLQRRAETAGTSPLYRAPLQDALKAALDLTDTHEYAAEAHPFWFHLTAVAAEDAGLIERKGVWKRLGGEEEHTRAEEAYRSAKERLRSQAFGGR
jgi:hypothetical protein